MEPGFTPTFLNFFYFYTVNLNQPILIPGIPLIFGFLTAILFHKLKRIELKIFSLLPAMAFFIIYLYIIIFVPIYGKTPFVIFTVYFIGGALASHAISSYQKKKYVKALLLSLPSLHVLIFSILHLLSFELITISVKDEQIALRKSMEVEIRVSPFAIPGHYLLSYEIKNVPYSGTFQYSKTYRTEHPGPLMMSTETAWPGMRKTLTFKAGQHACEKGPDILLSDIGQKRECPSYPGTYIIKATLFAKPGSLRVHSIRTPGIPISHSHVIRTFTDKGQNPNTATAQKAMENVIKKKLREKLGPYSLPASNLVLHSLEENETDFCAHWRGEHNLQGNAQTCIDKRGYKGTIQNYKFKHLENVFTTEDVRLISNTIKWTDDHAKGSYSLFKNSFSPD